MEVFRQPDEVRAACDAIRARGERVGLVPTMGALHDGHLTLVAAAKRRCDAVVTSVFVNPTQFGPHEDFGRYPRTLEADVAQCHAAGAHVFAPSVEAMYPTGDETRVRVGPTAAALCGAHRPGHFEGVATVVTKLFAMVGPCTAFFGRKDYQQLQILRRVVRDLFLPVDVVGLPTVREPDGLALSSRNAYLAPPERARALALPRALRAAHAAYASGERRAGALEAAALAEVERAIPGTETVPVRIDYVTVADADTVVPFAGDARIGERAVLALAVRVGSTRLIDNTVFGEDPPPPTSAPASGGR